MEPWTFKVHLYDLWTNDELNFKERRDRIVRRLRSGQETGIYLWSIDQDGCLVKVLNELAEADDAEEFDAAWAQFCEWADIHRVSVNVHSRQRRPYSF